MHIFSQDQLKPRSFQITRSAATEPLAMAVSPDDRSVAIGFGKSVAVCDVRNAKWIDKQNLTKEEVWEQVVNFSHDSSRVVVAYRYGSQGSVSCSTWMLSTPHDSRSNAQIGNWKKVRPSFTHVKRQHLIIANV